MRPYQEKYIENCLTIRALSASVPGRGMGFDQYFEQIMDDRRRIKELARENTDLLQAELLPLLDDLYLQDEDTLAELEAFADELTKGPKAIDVVLACQLHEGLLSCARRRGKRETVIRELYKLGMARYGMWNMLTGLNVPEAYSLTSQMRYCFVEASSYLKYFDEFQDDETKGYILRSTANIYMGNFADWHEKLNCVRNTMRIFRDEHYRQSAPSLPWDRYMQAVHRQMSGVMPYNLAEGSLLPDDVADVMESTHLVYEKKFEDIRHEGHNVEAHNLLPYYSVEFSCGLITKEELMKNLEDLMDPADPTRYDQSSIYQIVSLPPYYLQYLTIMPELIPPRREYIAHLYEKLLRFVRAMPTEVITDSVHLYVRQAMSIFVEFEGGRPYWELLLALMSRFAPELYARGVMVAQLAQAVSEAILDGDPSYFDDIPDVASAPQGARRSLILGMAEQSGLLMNMGMMNFTAFYDRQSRQLLRSEDEIIRCHTTAGWLHMRQYGSTKCCADAALGHHRWYDGNGGYPDSYHRRESPYRAMVDIMCVADYLAHDEFSEPSLERPLSFAEKLDYIFQMEGRQFSPLVSSWLRDPTLQDRLGSILENGFREGYRQCFRAATE